jgi:hypothetical protein
MSKIIDKVKAWYHAHVQEHIAAALVGVGVTDFLTASTQFHAELTKLVGERTYAAIRIVGAAIIWYRARQVKKPAGLPPPDARAAR